MRYTENILKYTCNAFEMIALSKNTGSMHGSQTKLKYETMNGNNCWANEKKIAVLLKTLFSKIVDKLKWEIDENEKL